MRAAHVQGVSRRKWVTTTRRDPEVRSAPDRVQRDFHVDGHDRLWVADITYVPTGVDFLYLAVALDAWSRCVIGWAMETHLRTDDPHHHAMQVARVGDVLHLNTTDP